MNHVAHTHECCHTQNCFSTEVGRLEYMQYMFTFGNVQMAVPQASILYIQNRFISVHRECLYV